MKRALSLWGGRSLAGRTSPSVKRTTQIFCLPNRHCLGLPQGYLPEADPGISSFGQLSNLFLNAIQGSQNHIPFCKEGFTLQYLIIIALIIHYIP